MEIVYTYKVIAGTLLNPETIKRTDADGNEAWIPTDPANSDYTAYVAWAIDEGIMEAPVIEPVITEPEAE